jgi:hypothetical protein
LSRSKEPPGAERAATTSPAWLDAPDRYSQRKKARQEGGNQVVVLDDLGEVGAFGIAIEVRRAR